MTQIVSDCFKAVPVLDQVVLDQVENPKTAGLAKARLRKSASRHDDFEFFDLAEIFRFFKRNLRTIAGAIMVALAAMTAYLALTKTIYRADAQLLIDANVSQVFREQYGEARGLLDSAQVESQIAILRSEQIALAVIKKMNLLAPSEATDAPRRAGAANDEGDSQEIRRAMAVFHRGLRVRRVGPSYVIEVSYHSTDPETAARVANATVEAYIHDQIANRAEAARQGSQWLVGRIDELRIQMNIAALKVQEFKVKRDYRILSKLESGQAADQQVAASKVAQNTLEELESTAQTYRKIYESYLQAHTELVQRQSFPVTNARVITKAASYKSHPKVPLLLLLAVAAGAFLGLAIALLRQTSLNPRHRLRGSG